MAKNTRKAAKAKLVTVGMDVSDRKSTVFILRDEAEKGVHGTVPTTRDGIARFLKTLSGKARVILETGTHSSWIADLIEEEDHEAVVVDARQLPLITQSHAKTDRRDAEMLAYLGRDELRLKKLLKPVRVKPVAEREHLAILKVRDSLVRARTVMVNNARGVTKSLGERLPSCDTENFHQLRERLSPELLKTLQPALAVVEKLTEEIKQLDKQVNELAKKTYPQTQRLTQVYGVGNLVALMFVLQVGDPKRFAKSRTVASYFGLVPGRDQSGDGDPELGITKRGSSTMRRLLVQSAQRALQSHAEDSDLKRFGQKLSGTSARQKRRAVVATARKLAVLLHRLWVTGEEYQPLGYGKKQQSAVAA